ncbi:hypothetical protein [Dyella japonica]
MLSNVVIDLTNTEAKVIAIYEYYNSEPAYRLRYIGADGNATERAWAESALREA